MKIIIPMAGRGSRLRPHTLTIPKPLVSIAGKPIVQRIVEDLSNALNEPVDEVAFIIGDFGKEAEDQLQEIATRIGAKCSIYHQEEPLGPGHAVLCAAPSLEGHCLVAFADTLFNANFNFDINTDGIIWVQQVDNPSSFGVITTNEDGYIADFVEKPTEFVSDKAIVGIYYFNDGDKLKATLNKIVNEDIKEKGEYQLTTALELMKESGTKFLPSQIDEWLDCGNKENVVATNQRMLEIKKGSEKLVDDSVQLENSVIIPPCYIGENVCLRNSVVGPYVSIGNNSIVEQSVISNSLIQHNTKVRFANLQDSMLGNEVDYEGQHSSISIGDYSSMGS